MSYLYLFIAILGEVSATTALKECDGFTKLLPSAVVIAGYGTALGLLSLTLRTIPVGITYAVWAGAGTALVVVVDALKYDHIPTRASLFGIGLIVAGIIIIHAGSNTTRN